MPGNGKGTAGVTVLAVIGITLLALNSRVSVSAVSSIASLVPHSFELSTVWLGWFAFAVPAAFAIASPVANAVIGRLGPARAAAAFAAGIAVMSLARIGVPNTEWLFASHISVLVFMGGANVALPVLVKAGFRRATGSVSALYISLFAAGAALPAFFGVRLSATWGWRASFVVWAAIALLGAIAWLPAIRSYHPFRTAARPAQRMEARPSGSSRLSAQTGSPPSSPRERPPNLFESRAAIAICILSAIASLNFYTMFGLLPTILNMQFGFDAVEGGLLLGFYSICQIPASIVLPMLISKRWLGVAGSVLGAGFSSSGYVLLSLGIDTLAMAGILAIGIGQLTFPLFLTLIVQRADDVGIATKLSAQSQMVGFSFAAIAPVLTTMLVAAGVSWGAVLAGLAVVSCGGILAGFLVGTRTLLGHSISQSGTS